MACCGSVFKAFFVALGPNQVAVGSFHNYDMVVTAVQVVPKMIDFVLGCSPLFFVF